MAVLLFHKGKTFEDQVVYVSGNAYDGCTFRRCTMVLAGISMGSLVKCSFDSCIWHVNLLIHDEESARSLSTILADMISKSVPQAPPQTAP